MLRSGSPFRSGEVAWDRCTVKVQRRTTMKQNQGKAKKGKAGGKLEAISRSRTCRAGNSASTRSTRCGERASHA
jgi:hypothetical protein